ncbi:MAG: shikimate dehydrogenase [Oscillospiraceae bacterium]|nr:shikimate dehydrogenase [Oscillospiraceae bacterium]
MFLALIGDPVAHSLSPAIHGAVFRELGLPLRYETYRVEKGALDGWLPMIRAEGIDGFNVTMPHKLDIAAIIHRQHSHPAGDVSPVNTVRVEADGTLSGFSTDEGGFLLSLSELGFDTAGKRVVIAGRGGVAQSLSAALEGAGAAGVRCVSVRDAGYPGAVPGVSQKGADTANRAAGSGRLYGELSALMPETDLLINATPLGMSGHEWEDFSFLRLLPGDALVYDLLYTPPVTALLREAAALGLRTQNGLPMLICQAILSDGIYLGQALDASALKDAVLRAL